MKEKTLSLAFTSNNRNRKVKKAQIFPHEITNNLVLRMRS